MNPYLVVGGGLAFLLGMKLMAKVKAAEELKFSLKDVSIDSKNSNIKQLTFIIKLNVTNPNDEQLSFNGFMGDVLLNGSKLGSVNIGNTTKTGVNVVFPPKQTMTLVIPFVIKNFDALLSICSFIASIIKEKSDIPIYARNFGTIGINGTLIALEAQFKVNTTIKLRLPKENVETIKNVLSLFGK